jgi:TRAP-type C4-dicarboxylate transport system permease small subunit
LEGERSPVGWFEKLLHGMALLAGVVLLLLTVFTVADVVMRYFFNAPFRGSLEATEYAMALIVFLSLAWCGATGGHIAVDLFDRWLDRPSLRWLPTLMSLTGAVLFAVVAWQVAAEAFMGFKQISNMLRWPHWPFKLGAAFGAFCFALVMFRQTWRAAGSAVRAAPAGTRD